MSRFIELLEDRSLFSVSIVPALSATILADQVVIADAKLAIKTTSDTWNSKLFADRKAIPATRKLGLTAIRDARAEIVLDRGNPSQVSVDEDNLRLAIQNARSANFAAVHQVPMDMVAKNKALTQARGAYHLAVRQLQADIVAHK